MSDIAVSTSNLHKNIPTISVFLCGAMANSLFKYASFEVIASFERSFYLLAHNCDKEQLICFCKDSLEIGPLNALCKQWPEGNLPAKGSIFQLNEACLYGQNLIIDLGKRHTWLPPLKPCFNVEKIKQGLKNAIGIMAERSPEKLGLAILLLNPDALSASFNLCQTGQEIKNTEYNTIITHIASNQILYNMSMDGLNKLCAWLQAKEALPQQAIASLIGLGSGLTPSGDDVLGGTLIAMHLLGDMHRLNDFANTLQHYFEHTNTISRAHLYAAMQGMGAAPLHDFIYAIMTNQDIAAFNAIAKRIDNIGHSSGWDITAGILLTLFSALPHICDK